VNRLGALRARTLWSAKLAKQELRAYQASGARR